MSRHRKRAAPKVVIAPHTPVSDALGAACEALYDAVGVRCVSRHLEVCFCNVCMTQDTRAQIIATPNADLSPALVQEYSNSAHGTVSISDDLIVLLPRYAELLSQDETVDYNESDEILWRFGAALKAGDMPDAVKNAYFTWGDLYFRHAAFVEAFDLDGILFPYSATKLLLSGGWSGAHVIGLLDEMCHHDEIGAMVSASLAAHVYKSRHGKHAQPSMPFISKYGLAEGALEQVLAWFRGASFDAALDKAMARDIPYDLFMSAKGARDVIALTR